MQWWLLMGDDDGTPRYLHSYDEIMKGKGVLCVATQMRCRSHDAPLQCIPARSERASPFAHGRQVRDVQRRQRPEGVRLR